MASKNTKMANTKENKTIASSTVVSSTGESQAKQSDSKVHLSDSKVLLLGIGNVLWADEGFGVRAIEYLNKHYQFSENVSLMDGGTQGLYLVPYIQQAEILVVFDAIDYGLAPGEMKIILDDDVPKFMGAKKMSLHQTGFQEVLSMSELLGDYPDRLMLIGVQPVELEDYGGSLRPEVKSQLAPACAIALEFLQALGINAKKRSDVVVSAEQALAPSSMAIEAYEQARPSEDEAWRLGDDRILTAKNIVFEPKTLLDPNTKQSINVDQRKQD